MSLESAAAQLAAILAVIYLLDCFRWVARNAVVFRRVPPFAARVGGIWQIARQFDRGLVFGFPLPPFGSMLSAEDWPFVPGPNGIRFVAHDAPLHAAPTASELFVAWKDVSGLRFEDLTLVHEGKTVHRFGSKRAARETRQLLTALSKAEPKKRTALIREALERRFEVKTVTERLKTFRFRRVLLGIADVALFIALFGLLAVLMNGEELKLWMFVPVALTWIAALVTTLLAVRQLEKDLRPSVGSLIIALVSPVSLMRSNDLVEPEWLAELHPTAVAQAVLPMKDAQGFVDERLRAVVHMLRGEGALKEGDAFDDDVAFRALLEKPLAKTVKSLGGPVTVPTGNHCPRCLTEYTPAIAVCDRCGIALTAPTAGAGVPPDGSSSRSESSAPTR